MAFGMPSSVGLGVLLGWKDQMSPGMAKAGRNLAKLKKQATSAAAKIERQAERLQASMLRYQTGFRSSLRVAGVGLAMATPLLLASKAAATFEDSMNDVLSLLVKDMPLDEARKQVALLKSDLLSFAGKTRIPLRDVGVSAYKLVSALGMETARAAFRITANMAVAAKGTVDEATVVMNKSLSTFGKRWGDTMTEVEKAEKIFNVISGTVSAFDTDLSQLAQGMVYAAPEANNLGMKFAEMTSIIGALQTIGLPASMSGTSFIAMMRGLTNLKVKFGDTAKGAKEAFMGMDEYLNLDPGKAKMSQKNLNETGKILAKLSAIKISDESGYILPFENILKQIEDVLGMTPKTAAEMKKLNDQIEAGTISVDDAMKRLGVTVAGVAAMSKVFGDEGKRGIAPLLGRSGYLSERIKLIEKEGGALKMLAVRQSGTTAKWQIMTNAVKAQIIRLGDHYLPMITKVITGITNFTTTISVLSKLYPKTARWIAWGLAIGSVVLTVAGIVGALVFALKMLQTQMALVALLGGGSKTLLGFGLAAKAASVATWLFNAALWANPITWIVVGVIALAAGLYLVIKHWKSISKAIVQAYDAFMIANKPMFDMFKNLWGGLVDWLKNTWESFSRWITNSPIYLGLRSITEGLGGLLGIGGEEGGRHPAVTPATISPKVLPPTIRAVTDVALSKPEEIDTAGGVTGPALPSGGVPRDVTTNHFRITTQGPVDEKKLAREITKLQMLQKMRTVQGVN